MYDGVKKGLTDIPVNVEVENSAVTVKFKELLICGINVEEEVYKIYNVSSEWKDKTSYHCDTAEDGTWFYYLETIDECIGESKRLVMFEAQKGSKTVKHDDIESALKEIDAAPNQDEKYRLVIKLMQEKGIKFAPASPSHLKEHYRILADGSSIFVLSKGYKINMCNADKILVEDKVELKFDLLYKSKKDKIRDTVRPWQTKFNDTKILGKVILCLAAKQ